MSDKECFCDYADFLKPPFFCLNCQIDILCPAHHFCKEKSK